ncbi:MAG: IS21-like element helper ATPase IstB [Bacteroidales bacterium]|jgi:DNA replication protein DnaC|nr:IS21-like element helper ATPase IstB [Bacteroidales bacterium]
MDTKTQTIKQYAAQLRLGGIQDQLDQLIQKASEEQCSYLDFSLYLLQTEITQRSLRDLERRTKAAKLPPNHDLDQYDYAFQSGIGKQQLMQLRECQWLQQNYNIVLMGPSGIGKTMIAAGLCFDALKMGYKAYFRTMEQLNEILTMKDITRSALIEYNKLLTANLLVIDDIMMFALEKKQAVQLFNFINHLHERASFIVTTNKSPQEWVKMLDDEVIATALLDRILFHCEVVRLSGNSYRLENRKTIFN